MFGGPCANALLLPAVVDSCAPVGCRHIDVDVPGMPFAQVRACMHACMHALGLWHGHGSPGCARSASTCVREEPGALAPVCWPLTQASAALAATHVWRARPQALVGTVIALAGTWLYTEMASKNKTKKAPPPPAAPAGGVTPAAA